MAQPARAPGFADIVSPQMLMIILIFGIWVLLVIVPQTKQYNKQQKAIKAVQSGDRVITNGGVYGTILQVIPEDETLILEIAKGVEIKILRASILGLAATLVPAAVPAEKTEK